MLRPPNEYESTRVNLSNRVVKIDNLFFDRAVIFFVPKVANKGVDLASLQCTIVQVTDRGEWGKEEESFTVDASSFSNRKYREFDLTTDAEYSLRITPPPELRMGMLEIYFDPTISSSTTMATINNPSSGAVDLSAITAAISAGSAAEVAAINDSKASSEARLDALYQQKDRANRTVAEINESVYEVTEWSQTPSVHVACAPNPDNIAIEILNTSTTNVYWDTFLNISIKSSAPQFNNVMPPGGSIRIDGAESSVGVMLYQIGTNAEGVRVSINLERDKIIAVS